MVIKKNNSDAMNNLGDYYKKQKDCENMMKYYLMAIENNNSFAMYGLGYYYKEQKDYENMIKYYLITIENNNNISNAMTDLGYYYYEQKDYENMMKYYFMAIEKNNSCAMLNLGHHYYKQNDHENMMKYYLMAIENNNSQAMYNLGHYYYIQKDYENAKKYLLMDINDYSIQIIKKLSLNINEILYILKNLLNNNMLIDLNEIIIITKDWKLYDLYKNQLSSSNIKVFNNINILQNKDKECTVCYNDKSRVLPCHKKHILCENCLLKCNKCPFCRKTIF